jgi:hypothetical protein
VESGKEGSYLAAFPGIDVSLADEESWYNRSLDVLENAFAPEFHICGQFGWLFGWLDFVRHVEDLMLVKFLKI